LKEKLFLSDSDSNDSIFPFDPCLLERTAKLVENEYQGWFSTEEGNNKDGYVFESESDQIDSDEDENSDSEFSNVGLLVDRSKLPAAIRIPKITSAALRMLGGYSIGSSPHASHWGFGGIKTQSITSSLGSPKVVGTSVGRRNKRGASTLSSLNMALSLSSTPDIPKLIKTVGKESLQTSEASSMDSGSSIGSGEW